MIIPKKTEEEINIMREGGKILAEVLEKIVTNAKEGMSTYELDQLAENLIIQKGCKPAFKGYHGFPATLCTCLNNKIVHGIPKKNEILKNGDLLTIDCGIIHKKMYTDAARSLGIGKISKEKEKLIKTAYEALKNAIAIIRPGIHLGEIGKTIEKTVNKAGFHIIHDLTGHGIGYELHEEPVILNYWKGKPGPVLEIGMTLAIEPIFAVSTSQMKTLNDNWTVVTADGSAAVQAENTILITQNGAEILTCTKC